MCSMEKQQTNKIPANATRPEEKVVAPRYIDILSDIGFKIVFGNRDNPELMIGLLNALLPDRKVENIEFLGEEIRPEDISDKRVCFDIRCVEKDGRSFVVEVQKREYDYMMDRLVTYAGDPLKRMLKAGQDYAEIQPLYIICITNHILKFKGDTEDERKKLVRSARICLDDTKQILSDKLYFIFLQTSVVTELTEDQSFLEQWAYAVRQAVKLDSKPDKLKDPYFDRMFQAAERKYINDIQLQTYDYIIRDEIQIKYEREFAVREAVNAAVEVATKEARAQALEQGAITKSLAIAKAMKQSNIDNETIAQCTGLSVEQVVEL